MTTQREGLRDSEVILRLLGKENYLARGSVRNGEYDWTVIADKISVTEMLRTAPASPAEKGEAPRLKHPISDGSIHHGPFPPPQGGSSEDEAQPAVPTASEPLREAAEYAVAKSDKAMRCWGCATMQREPVGGPAYGPFPHSEDCFIEKLRAALRSPAPQASERVREGYTLVPNSALRWLFGEEGDFVMPEKGTRNYSRPYWWRTEFRKRIADAGGSAPTSESSKK